MLKLCFPFFKYFLGRESLAEHELIFSVLCPPLGYTIVYVEKSQTKNSEIQIQTVQNLDNASQTLQILQNVTVSMEYYTGKGFQFENQ